MKSWASLGMALMGFLVLGTGCSVSKDQVKQVLKQNPDIVFDFIKEHPEGFMDAVQQANNQARQLAAVKEQKAMDDQIQAQMKSPIDAKVPEGRAMRGLASAPILIVEYSDFQCPYCRRGFDTVEALRKKYGDKIAFEFRNFPLPFHPLAMPAAKRFEAIALQSPEKAYRFHDEVFLHQERLQADGEKFLDEAAKTAGANVAQMKKDMDGPKVTERLAADKEEATKLGISGTPGFVVGGVELKGAMPVEMFEKIIDTRLAGGAAPKAPGEASKTGSGKR